MNVTFQSDKKSENPSSKFRDIIKELENPSNGRLTYLILFIILALVSIWRLGNIIAELRQNTKQEGDGK
jgi:hypothetical protein